MEANVINIKNEEVGKVKLNEKIFNNLKHVKVMVIGAGEMSRITVLSMVQRGVKEVIVTNRSYDKAQDLADEVGGKAVPFDDWDKTLAEVDVVISSTGASEPVVRRHHIEAVRKKRKYRPLFMIDIAVPRDIETEAGEIEEVYLYDIDKLQQLANEARASREKQVAICRQMIDEEL